VELLELIRQLPTVEKWSAFSLPVGFVAETSAYCGQTVDSYSTLSMDMLVRCFASGLFESPQARQLVARKL
jgi:hypothetical protein